MFVKIASTYLFKQNYAHVIVVRSFASFHCAKTMVSHLAGLFAILNNDTNTVIS